MKIEVIEEPHCLVVRLQGNLDDEVREPFAETLHPLIDDGSHALLLDVSDCPRITSSGVGQLVMLVSRANAKGGRVILAGPSPYVQSILSATKLDRFFEIADSARAARKLLESG